MEEPTLPHNPDQDIPPRSGEEMGEPEPLAPEQPGPERATPRPEEETDERAPRQPA